MLASFETVHVLDISRPTSSSSQELLAVFQSIPKRECLFLPFPFASPPPPFHPPFRSSTGVESLREPKAASLFVSLLSYRSLNLRIALPAPLSILRPIHPPPTPKILNTTMIRDVDSDLCSSRTEEHWSAFAMIRILCSSRALLINVFARWCLYVKKYLGSFLSCLVFTRGGQDESYW